MATWKPDPVITELWTVKDAYAAEFDFDIDAICDHLIAVEKASGRNYVPYTPHRIVEKGQEINSTKPLRPTIEKQEK